MGTNQHLHHIGRRSISLLSRVLKQSLLIGALVATLLPQTLLAAVTSNVTGTTLTVTSDAGDPITITCDTLQVKINGADPGSGAALCASLTEIAVTGGPDSNTIDLSSVTPISFTLLTTITVDGAGASDVITGTNLADTLNGGDGDDTLTGHRGNDTVNGDGDNDTMIWNPGDGTDSNNGGDGDDTTVVNGGNVSETFTISGTGAGVKFDRVDPNPFTVNIDPSTENLQLNGNGGGDVVTGTTLLAGVITITVNGGDGDDQIKGGNGDDTLNGDGGNDTLTGFQGADTVNGDTPSGGFSIAAEPDGDDTMIWNPGDGSDINNGGGGNDTTVVNGGNVSETFTISGTGAGVRFDRVDPNPFSVDIDPSTENLLLNANGGDDVVTGTEELAGVITITVNGGEGNDIVKGGDGDDTLNGDGGNDSLTGFRGADTSSGGADDDTMIWNPGDGSDINVGGDGDDMTVVNGGNVSETFTISGTGAGVQFDRVDPNPFRVDIDPSTERLLLNGNGGADVVTGTTQLNGVITITVNGGDGPDNIIGGDGPDTLNGEAGNDRLVGFRAADTMNGGPDNDTMVWNNGDGSDIMDGGDGDDTVEVNGGGGDETFVITPSVSVAIAGISEALGSVFFQRVTPGPFSLDIEAEHVEVNGNDGDDRFDVTPLDNTTVHFDGGSQVISDSLHVDALDNIVDANGNLIVVRGKQQITHVGVEVIEFVNRLLQQLLPYIKNNWKG